MPENIDLNAPAFGTGSQSADLSSVIKKEEPKPVVEPAKDSVETPAEEVKEEVSEDTVETSVEENKVPYSRFKNIHQRAIEAEKLAEEYRAQVETLRQRKERVEETTDLPSYWKEMYGDSDASKRAYELQQEQNEKLLEQARQAAQEAARNERLEEAKRLDDNVNEIDSKLERLSTFVGRDLTEKEQSTVLDIIDEYTPKDDNGNYIGAMLSEEKAWDIYELKQKAQNVSKNDSRDKIASLSGSQSQGETSVGVDKSKDFNPLDWDSYKKRL